MIGVDSTVLIDILNGVYLPAEELSKDFVVCDLVYFEVLVGRAKKEYVDIIIGACQTCHSNFGACERGAEIYRQLHSLGKEIGSFDCLIAAIYLEHGVTRILTRNVKHFSAISGLTVVSY
jgi:predicted nucleic acid-binding protein